MADEEDLHDAGDDGEGTETGASADNEGSQSEGATQTKAFDVEEFAGRMGWSPKDKWRGNPEDWKPADQFVESTVSFNKTLKRELKSVRETTERMARTTAAMTERAISDERAKWEQRHTEAVEAGDNVQAFKAAQEITKIDTAPRATDPTGDGAVKEFIDRNSSWFSVDPIATAFAQQVAEMHKTKPYSEQVEIAEREVKKRFPEYFQAAARAKEPAAVNAPSNQTARPLSRTKGVSDMPKDAQAACAAGVKRGRWKAEEFAAEYWKENA